MEDLLISILEVLGYPVKLQGSLLPDEPYPASFFTYWNDSADGDGFFNNDESKIIWEYSINFYSDDPAMVNTKLIEAKNLLKRAGFIVTGGGYSIPTDEATHTGRGLDVIFMEVI